MNKETIYKTEILFPKREYFSKIRNFHKKYDYDLTITAEPICDKNNVKKLRITLGTNTISLDKLHSIMQELITLLK